MKTPTDLQKSAVARDNAILSALSIRLLLEFEPWWDDARARESALVAGHMRCCYSVPKHRRYLRSGTPSEPVLAEAAARIMNKFPCPVENLKGFLENGLISKGERGELVAQLLLTLAHDQALLSDLAHDLVIYSQPVPVINFLKKLISRKHLEGILQSQPANVFKGQTLEEAFQDARLNFTHFVKAGESRIISDEIAWMGLARGMAFVCANGEEAIDLVIPILLWDKPLSRFVVSAIFFQFKNRVSKKRVNTIDAAKLGFFTPAKSGEPDKVKCYNIPPYITIVMNLGVVQHLSMSKTGGKERSQGKPPPVQTEPGPTRGQPQRGKTNKEVHPRYAITITGCSNEVYGVIGSGTEASFAQMLSMYDLLNEHPRPDKKYQDAVLRMKPFWMYDPNSLHWTDHTMEQEVPELETVHTGQEAEGYESDSDMEVKEG